MMISTLGLAAFGQTYVKQRTIIMTKDNGIINDIEFSQK